MSEKNEKKKKEIWKIDVKVGKAVNYARLQCGVTQKDIARALGCTFQQVQKQEKGINRLSPGKLTIIAKLLEKPISYFYDADIDNDLIDSAKNIANIRLINYFSKIKDPTMRKQIMSLIKIAANIDDDETDKVRGE